MPVILSIETSTQACSVALNRDGKNIASIELMIERAHSEKLTRLITDCLDYAGVTMAAVDAFAVSMGPGSYTGLRIGVATAKGLCYALDKPLIAINTLEAMAHHLATVTPDNYVLCPMLDARRMEVYCALFAKDLSERMPTSAKIVDENSFAAELQQYPIVFFGNGAAKCKAVLAHQPNAFFPDRVVQASAVAVGELAQRAYARNQFADVAYFEPFYLKEFLSKVAN